MKKIILPVAAMAVSMAMADVVSSSIVGYMTYPSTIGINNIGAAFTPINATGDWVCDTKVYDTDATQDDVVSFLNFDIFDLDSYQFLGYNGSGDSLGWVYNTSDMMTGDPIQTPVASFTLGKGQVTYCQPGDGISGFTTSGEVEDTTTSAVVEFKDDGVFEFVNPFPKDTTIGDLQSFCSQDDVLMVLNFEIFDLDSYQYLGAGNGWTYNTSDMITGDPIQEMVTDTATVVLPAGQGGYYQPGDGGDRTWTVTL